MNAWASHLLVALMSAWAGCAAGFYRRRRMVDRLEMLLDDMKTQVERTSARVRTLEEEARRRG